MQGFNVLHWRDGGLSMIAVSDLKKDELEEFGTKFVTAEKDIQHLVNCWIAARRFGRNAALARAGAAERLDEFTPSLRVVPRESAASSF